MAQEYENVAFEAAKLPIWFFVMRPEAAMLHAGLPRETRELNIWQMAVALRVDMVEAIKSGVLSRDAPLDLLQSMTRRCAACHRTDECTSLLRQASHHLREAPQYCRIKSRLDWLRQTQQMPGQSVS